MKKLLYLLAGVMMGFTSCTDDGTKDIAPSRDFQISLLESQVDALGSSEGVTVEVASNEYVQWTISDYPTWVSPLSTTGLGNENIVVKVDPSFERGVRRGTLRIDAYYNKDLFKSIDLPIAQAGVGPIIRVSTEEGSSMDKPLLFAFDQIITTRPAEDDPLFEVANITDNLITNIDWQAVVYTKHEDTEGVEPTEATWLQVDVTNPDAQNLSGEYSVVIKRLAKNTESYDRKARIIVTPLTGEVTPETTAVIYVTQTLEAKLSLIENDTPATAYTLPSEENTSKNNITSKLSTNVNLTAAIYEGHQTSTTLPDWIEISYTNPSGGEGGRELSITRLDANTEVDARHARIVLSPLDNTELPSVTLYITQQGAVAQTNIVIPTMLNYLSTAEGTLILNNGSTDAPFEASVTTDAANTTIQVSGEIADGDYTMVKFTSDDGVEKALGGIVSFAHGIATKVERWDNVFSQFGGESAERPIWIKSALHLKTLANRVNNQGENYAGLYFKQENDIALTDYQANKGWVPIGDLKAKPFSGNYDGNNKNISGLVITTTEMGMGLFGFLKGDATNRCVVKNIVLSASDGAKIEDSSVGGYCGSIANTALDYTTIENCKNYVPISAGGFCGGIVAMLSDVTMLNTGFLNTSNTQATVNNANVELNNCHNFATITLSDATSTSKYNSGGIVGVNGGVIRQCSNQGDMSITAIVRNGGLVGLNLGTIRESFNSGDVISGANSSGGITGFLAGTDNSLVLIENCYNSGNISRRHNSVGGIIGSMSNTGFTATLINCYSKGANGSTANTTATKTGGILGTWHPTLNDISGCFYLKDKYWGNKDGELAVANALNNAQTNFIAAKQAESGKEDVILKDYLRVTTEAEMVEQSTFTNAVMGNAEIANWDFSNIWVMGTNGTNENMPILKWQTE